MPSPFYGTDAVYGLRALLGTSNIADIDAGFAALRDDVAAKMKGAVPRVTALPTVGPSGSGSLVDGQECYFVADATNGVQWHFRYNASSSSAYKWEFIGGPALYAEVTANEMVASNTYIAATTAGPAITLPTLPTGGDYEVLIGGRLSAVSTTFYMSYDIGGVAAVDADAVILNSGTVSAQASVQSSRRKNGLTSAITLTAKYRSASGGTNNFAGSRFIGARPIRVG